MPVLFIEVDGLWVHLQQHKQRSTEEKMLTVHEGWQPRYSASRFVYSHYDISNDTVVVINGDRANWIRQGTKYFPIPEATVDYRHRLAAQGLDTTNMRGLGAAESQADSFADRVKGRGRSWSPTGLSAMMELLCWWNTDRLQEVTARLQDWLRDVDEKLDLGSDLARRAVEDVLNAEVGGTSTLSAGVPITGYGKTGSGGMSYLMNRIVGGGLASAAG